MKPLDMSMQPEIRERKAQSYLYVRRLGDYSRQARPAWEELHTKLEGTHLVGPHTEMIGVCHDDPAAMREEELRYDAGITVAPNTAATEGLTLGALPKGRFAVFTYRGTYDHLGVAFGQIFTRWVPNHQKNLRFGACLEVYLNNPDTTPIKELLTELWIPVKWNT